MRPKFHLPYSQWVVALLFLLMTYGAVFGYLAFLEPDERKPSPKYDSNYSDALLTKSLTQQSLNSTLAAIKAAGERPDEKIVGRMTGTPGFYRTEKLITDTFRKAGMKIYTQQFSVTVPETQICELQDESGKPIPGMTLYPLEPSGLIPNALPKSGVSGPVVLTNSGSVLDLSGKRIEDSIVINMGLDCQWADIASMGAKAFLIYDDPADPQRLTNPIGQWATMTTGFDVPYPRYFVRGPVENLKGKRVTIKSKVVWKTKSVRNIIGVLEGKPGSKEALTIAGFYDSYSIVPDYAPGGEQAITPALLMEFARALAPYKGKMVRDVVFVATAGHCQNLEGVTNLMQSIEKFTSETGSSFIPNEKLLEVQKAKLAIAKEGLKVADDDSAWSGGDSYRTQWQAKDRNLVKWYEQCFTTVAGEIDLDLRERFLAARLDWIRAGRPTYKPGFDIINSTPEQKGDPANRHPLLAKYIDAKTDDTRAGDLISTPFYTMSQVAGANFDKWQYRQRMRDYIANRVIPFHTRRIKELEDSRLIRKVWSKYNKTLIVNLELYSGGPQKLKDLAVVTGRYKPGTLVEPQSSDLKDAILSSIPRVNDEPMFKVTSWGINDAAGGPNDPCLVQGKLESELWFKCEMQAYSIVSKGFIPNTLGTPLDTFESFNTDVIRDQIQPLGKALLAISNGRVPFKKIKYIAGGDAVVGCNGTIFTSAGTSSLVPSHRVGVNTFARVYVDNPDLGINRGVKQISMMEVNPYGEYYRKFNIPWPQTTTVDAVKYNDDGQPVYYKDLSPDSQGLFNSDLVHVSVFDPGSSKPMNVALFRAAPVACYQKVNPKSLNVFPGFSFLTAPGLQEPEAFHEENLGPAFVAYLPPDLTFYVAMKDGSSQNPDIQTYRGFMLNLDPKTRISKDIPAKNEPELFGRGYLVADTPNLTYPYFDAAASMLRTNWKRLILQRRYHMADEQMEATQKHGEEFLDLARKYRAMGNDIPAVNAASRSLGYAISNHPVIRSKISNAIVGIIWYLGLLVPFVFFFEKLILGCADIRKQLLVNGIIFVLVFALLQYFHPAFKMVSAPMMILLGFLMLLLSLLVSVMVGGKFMQTISVLRRKEGYVEGADINRGGVVGTAFMLGLNNMRKRKVRTGLTCVTLVLITFVMICFTSVSTDLVDSESPTGRAPSNGIMRRDPNFFPLTPNEISNTSQIYGLKYPVSSQAWVVAALSPVNLKNTDIQIERVYSAGTQSITKRVKVNAAIRMSYNEPQFSGIDKYLLTKRGWFPAPIDVSGKAYVGPTQQFVMLPESAAKGLGLTPKQVDSGHEMVTIQGGQYEVFGIFDSVKLTDHVGMDGHSIMPYDLNSVQTLMRRSDGTYIVPQTADRLKGSQVMITNVDPLLAGGQVLVNVSCSILFPDKPYRLKYNTPVMKAVTYREQRKLILEYLERIGIGAFYAVDRISYYGSRTRGKTIAGLIELLIPILIAAMTVFNTMRGSVYERKDEIYVYNAVGIAPNHVFFMFMAEACVYSVVGAMLGYLLSQISGTVMTSLGIAGGLNMDYSSIETIYVSLAIVASVLLSTLIPARTAARLALPSDERSWTIPKAEDGIMTFPLPFTFGNYDRMAVISYFHRWLDSNGEGSSGHFFCSPPQVVLNKSDKEPTHSGMIPGVETTVWLKPFDLGVSQKVLISLPTDPETGEYVAYIRIEMLTGTTSAWRRVIMPFLKALRKQFLNWRAVGPEERSEMYEESKRLFGKVEIE